MKIKNIINICKKTGAFITFIASQQQWLCDGFGAYPIKDIPKFDEDLICTMYDIPDTAREKISFKIQIPAPKSLDFSDRTDDENFVEAEKISIKHNGMLLIPYKTSQGLMFVDSQYLKPFSDIKEENLSMWERTNDSGQVYFAVKNGMLCSGIILPLQVDYEEYADILGQMSALCRVSHDNKKERENNETINR